MIPGLLIRCENPKLMPWCSFRFLPIEILGIRLNRDHLIVFQTAWEDEWIFEFLINQKTNETAFRQFEQSIEVSDENLYLVNWTDLTSSLQFENTKLPDKINEDLKIKIPNGFYKVTVKQLFDHDDDYDSENKVSYVVELISEPNNPYTLKR